MAGMAGMAEMVQLMKWANGGTDFLFSLSGY